MGGGGTWEAVSIASEGGDGLDQGWPWSGETGSDSGSILRRGSWQGCLMDRRWYRREREEAGMISRVWPEHLAGWSRHVLRT